MIKIIKYEKICLCCGKNFITHKKNVVVCSPKCSKQRKKDKDNLYWKKYYQDNKERILEKNRKWWKLNNLNTIS